MVIRLVPLALIAALAACGGETAEESNLAAIENAAGLDGAIVELPAGEGGPAAGSDAADANGATASRDDWIGTWTGVEGTMLEVAAAPDRGAGSYTLTMQYTLDDKGSFEGTATPEGIAFSRPDGDHVLRATDGAATGLKYLLDKQDCLTVMQGEGYCRD